MMRYKSRYHIDCRGKRVRLPVSLSVLWLLFLLSLFLEIEKHAYASYEINQLRSFVWQQQQQRNVHCLGTIRIALDFSPSCGIIFSDFKMRVTCLTIPIRVSRYASNESLSRCCFRSPNPASINWGKKSVLQWPLNNCSTSVLFSLNLRQ